MYRNSWERACAPPQTALPALTHTRPLVQAKPAEIMAVFEHDLHFIRERDYKLPWDMSPSHRQFDPFHGLDQFRRATKAGTQVLVSSTKGDSDVGKVPYGKMSMYPDYYQNNFHFQTGLLHSSCALPFLAALFEWAQTWSIS